VFTGDWSGHTEEHEMIRTASKLAPFARRDDELPTRRGTVAPTSPRSEIFGGWGPKF
jgi:hypothetical protein